jgi:hypothetical protein
MRPQPPAELTYIRTVVEDRLRRMRNPQESDAGLNTLEYVVLAAIIVPCAVALAVFIVAKVKSYQNKIK